MKNPPKFKSETCIEAGSGIRDPCVEICGSERTGARGKAEEATVSVDSSFCIHMPIPYKSRNISSPREPIVSRQIRIFELSDAVFCEIETDFMMY